MDTEVEALKRAIADALRDERWAEALPLLETWCSRFPDRASGWLNLGYCLVRLGRLPDAVAAFDRCLVLDPQAAKARGWREHALAGMAPAAPPAAQGDPGAASGAQPPPAAGGDEPPAEPAPAAPTHATIAIPDVSRGWPVGTVVDGRYEVREVARGGMAVVAIAFDRELRRMVAIKTPLPSALASAEGRARFQREAESWIALGLHPNICCAYYLQELGGMPRLFVEHVDGGDLGQWLRREDPARLDESLDIAIQVAVGLDYTHSFVWTDDEGVEHRGVVHRDVKPANILLGSDGVARVTDFGLVRVEDGVGERESPPAPAAPPPAGGSAEDSFASGSWQTVTIEGGLVGTPPYMAPELWRKAHRGTAATDIYAYGCMLYEIFCGRRPLLQAGDTASQTREENLVGWMRLHLRQEPPDPQALRQDLPARLAALLRGCVAKRPA
ncbi:MAG: protein kinase, partial [Thermoanaerobaculales bacterium]|nr:protein kinase [Thermoanaerobaculales bacterium]